MQIDQTVANNYAHALLMAIQKVNLPLDEALNEANAIEELIETHPKFMVFLIGPQFREDEKQRFVEKTLKGKLAQTFFLFLLLLLRRNRPEYLPAILAQLKLRIEETQGIVSGTVQTAIELSDERKEYLQRKLEETFKKKFHFAFKVNPSLIGGVRVQYGDMLLDSSIETGLNDLRKKLREARILRVAS